METTRPNPETTVQDRAALFQDLRDCLGKEQKCLLDLDVNRLWTVMEEKQAILEALERLPAAEGPHVQVDRLKDEIRTRARENAEFIQSSLAVFDELILRIVGSGKDAHTYTPPGAGHPPPQGSIYRRKA